MLDIMGQYLMMTLSRERHRGTSFPNLALPDQALSGMVVLHTRGQVVPVLRVRTDQGAIGLGLLLLAQPVVPAQLALGQVVR